MNICSSCFVLVFMNYFDNPGGMIPTWLVNWAAKVSQLNLKLMVKPKLNLLKWNHLPSACQYACCWSAQTGLWWSLELMVFPVSIVNRCIAGRTARRRPSWVVPPCHMFTDRCFFSWQSGVPGFLSDMQKACSNYKSYCQKKWMTGRGKAIVHKGFDSFYYSRFGHFRWCVCV